MVADVGVMTTDVSAIRPSDGRAGGPSNPLIVELFRDLIF
jgi:hypothetical protein